MLDFKIVDAKSKDKEIITSMKLVTMIDNEMDKKLSYAEKDKIKKNIVKNIEQTYMDYKIIVVDKKVAGAFVTIPYDDGAMIDQLYLFSEFRGNGIGNAIISELKRKNKCLYVWLYKTNEDAISFFEHIKFKKFRSNGRIVIYKYDSLSGLYNDVLDNIKFGYRDIEGNKYLVFDRKFKVNYYLQSPEEILSSKIGMCFDQVELERKLLIDLGMDVQSYLINYTDKTIEETHAFVVYEDNDKFYWLENAWLKYKGIHSYDSLDELYSDVVNKFSLTIKECDKSKIELYNYSKPKYGINFNSLYKFCIYNNKNINRNRFK